VLTATGVCLIAILSLQVAVGLVAVCVLHATNRQSFLEFLREVLDKMLCVSTFQFAYVRLMLGLSLLFIARYFKVSSDYRLFC
jgi:hypothetical protein